jgi:hypothetical protein
MFRTLMIGAVSALTLSAAAFAQQGGTAQEAQAMLDKAVAAVKADQAVALAMFIKGEGGFLDRDLYPFCFRIADGQERTNGIGRLGTEIARFSRHCMF